MTASDPLQVQKAQARRWFEALRDELCAALERIEAELPAEAQLGEAWARLRRATGGLEERAP